MRTFPVLPLVLLVHFAESAVISTSYGRLDGDESGDFHLFKRIPFAKPPLGKLRFQKPLLPETWDGVRDAKSYGPACMSNSSTTQSPQKWIDEDCLHTNIFTSNKCLKSKDCAVVFYIHGGATNYDSAVMFNDTFLLGTFVNRDVVLVISAFRLGIFSHFVVENQNIAPTNLALYDILHGLEYVRREIHNFGGNNKKVTLLGHSYGGAIASMLTFSTKINRDLSWFQQSISMSSGHDAEPLALQIQKARLFSEQANCAPSPKLAAKLTRDEQDWYTMDCLQKMDAHQLLRIQRRMEDEGFPKLDSLVLREPLFQEVPYGEFMSTPKRIPMLTGCTRYEMDHSPSDKPIGEALGFRNPNEVDAKYRRDLRLHTFDFGNHSDETQAIFVQTRIRVDSLLKNGIPAYLYEYTYPKHAKHTDDLFYIMGVHRFEKDENERHLADVYETMFTNFAKFGRPGDGFEAATLENSTYFDVYWDEKTGERPQMKDGFEQKIVDYWLKDMVEYDRNVTARKAALLESAARRKSPRMLAEHHTSSSSFPYAYMSMLIVSLIFLTGCLVGRVCCRAESHRNLYIRLDGNDHDDYHRVVKHF